MTEDEYLTVHNLATVESALGSLLSITAQDARQKFLIYTATQPIEELHTIYLAKACKYRTEENASL